MKGLSTTILIVVTAVVILVAALVLLTIFGSGIQNVVTIAQAESMCVSEAQIACSAGIGTTNTPTATWFSPTKRLPDGSTVSCSTAVTSCTVKCEKGVFSCEK